MNTKMLKAILASFILSVSGFANAGLLSFSDGTGQVSITFNILNSQITANNSILIYPNDTSALLGFTVNYNLISGPTGFFSGGSGLSDITGNQNAVGIQLDSSSLITGIFDVVVSGGGGSECGPCQALNFGVGANILHWNEPNRGTLRINNIALGTFTFNSNINIATVPEPSTLVILALGIMGLASRRFKKQS